MQLRTVVIAFFLPLSAMADGLAPPSIVRRAPAVFPAGAPREGATVKLELGVDAEGRVTSARVLVPAGHGFDEAALDAAKRFVFAPAKRDGAAIASTVEIEIELRPPPPPPPQEIAQGGDSTLVLAQRPISAASSFAVRDREFQLRPIGSVQDILRVTPGLVLVQHSGGGKANQYFLRGFDADHGTDLALSIDGVPINMPSHAHGQGFSDTNFIIPEVVERVEITKGPYFTSQGDFATAGAVNMISRDAFERSSIGLGFGGSPGHGQPSFRALAIASPRIVDNVKATFAGEAGRSNGPFDSPDRWDKYKLFNKLTWSPSSRIELAVTEMSYDGDWHGSGQIPARAVEQGIIGRYGTLDPNEGGGTGRHQLSAQLKVRPSDASELKALAYAGTYRFNLFSNFTLFLNDADRGDEIEQVDRRVFYGGKLAYRVVERIGGVRFDTTIGGDVRSDDIHEELWHTRDRQRLDAAVRANDVNQTLAGVFVNEEVRLRPWARVVIGARGDFLGFAVADRTPAAQSGTSSATQLSPKASLVLTPLSRKDVELDLYANFGRGFHSNDVRGAFAQPAVTPLTRATGEELGARARLFERWDLAAAVWNLDLTSETVWNGDDGTTSVSGATNRYGVELETRFELTKWLAADLDVTFTRSAFKRDAGNAGGLALAPKETWSGGLSAKHALGPGVARGGLRFFGIGDRPASDDGAIVAPGFTELDLHLGYRLRRFDVAVDVENLLNQDFRSAQFDTTSRLANEPPIGAAIPAGFNCGSNARLAPSPNGQFAGCEGVSYTPAYPFTARVMATLYLD